MKAVLQEYGRLIIAVLVGGILLVFYYNFVKNEYQNVFPEQNRSHIEQTESRHLRPVIIVKERITIQKGDSAFRMSEGNMDKAYASFQSLAVAYKDSERRQEIPVKVYGVDGVDVNTKGMYEVLYTATNESQKTFAKTVNIIVN